MTTAITIAGSPAPADEPPPLNHPIQGNRFTLDGDDGLERRLDQVCNTVLAKVQKIVPARKLEALVLGGGYGRGEGGVLKTADGDQPYNDLEFYVFLRGNRIGNELKFGNSLSETGDQLSPEAGLHVEFKVDSLARLRRSPVTMFSYDLVAGHRVAAGKEDPFKGCEHHLDAGKIPFSEATRLLMNRCSGLLFAREKLTCEPFTAADADFVWRNMAKAQLAFGDALLAAFGQYHWSCRERQRRLMQLAVTGNPPWLPEARYHHTCGVEFKLHPHRTFVMRAGLQVRLAKITAFALQVWLWLENQRLGCNFVSARDYVSSPVNKCPGTNRWRNLLLNAKVFSPLAVLCANRHRHPHESVLNALAQLLWATDGGADEMPGLSVNPFSSRTAEMMSRVEAYRAIWRKLN